jgi:hypothetical protein
LFLPGSLIQSWVAVKVVFSKDLYGFEVAGKALEIVSSKHGFS